MRFRHFFGFFALSFGSMLRAIERHFFCMPVDAKTALTVDAIRHAARDAPGALSRFRAYLERALNHPAYTAGYFDPGRMYAA